MRFASGLLPHKSHRDPPSFPSLLQIHHLIENHCFPSQQRFGYILGATSEKEMAPHSSTLAWKIPWTEEPGRLHSMGSQRVTFTFHFHALEKEMAAHSSVLAWRIPGMGEPGGLPSMG